MTISFRTATGLAASSDTSSPFASRTYTLPTGHSTDDVLIAFYGGRPDTTTASTPTDYTAVGSVADTSGATFGNGTGQNRAQAFYKIHDGSESGPTSTFSAQYSPSLVAMLACYSSVSGSGWTVNYTTGSDNSSTGTSISATGGSLTWSVGDVIIIQSVGCDNLATESSAAISFSGGVAASGGLTEQLATNTTTTGNDGSMYVYTATITTGGTGAPTFTATSGGTNLSHRAVVFLQIREPSVPPPVASFTISDNAVWVGDSVSFTDTSTNTPTSWSWNFGSGASPATSTSQNPSGVTWSTTGTKTITMTATNAGGSDAADNGTVNVYEVLVANFTASDTTVQVGSSGTVDFTNTTTGADTSWSWDFGSGATPATSTSESPTGVYWTTTGTKTISLTSTNAGGSDVETKTAYIDVGNVPTASFTISDDTVWTGVGVNFTDTSTGSPTSWDWTFTSGTPGTSDVQNPTGVTWSAAEVYDVTLIASNAYGDSAEFTDQVYVYNPVTANFSADDTTPTTGQTVTFIDSSSAAATTWSWDFGSGADPATASTVGPHEVTYSTTGDKTISLTAGNAGGTDNETKTNYLTVSSASTVSVLVSEIALYAPKTTISLYRSHPGTHYNTFDGGTDGNTITTSNSTSGTPWDGVTGTPKWSSTYPKEGSLGVKLQDADTGNQYLQWTVGSTSQKVALQFWWRHPGGPSAEYRLCSFLNTGGSNIGGLIMRTTSVLTVMQLTSAVSAYNSPAMTAGNWYLIDLYINGSYTAGAATLQIRNEDLSIFHNYSGTFTGPSADTNAATFRWGRPLTTAYGYDMYADSFRMLNGANGTIFDTVYPMQLIPTLTPTKLLTGWEIYNGTSWRNDFEIWNGTSWRTDVEIWNGTSWIPHA